MNIDLENKLKKEALRVFPEEACGLVFDDDSFFPIPNVAERKEEAFAFCPLTYVEVLLRNKHKRVRAIWHSHTKAYKTFDLRTPSKADIALFEREKIPLLISGYDGQHYLEAVEFPKKLNLVEPYYGRPYIAGIYDCGTLARDFFYRELGLLLWYEFSGDWLEPKSWPLAVETFLIKNGFKKKESLYPMLPNDIILVNFAGMKDAHGVIYLPNDFVLDQRQTSCLVAVEDIRERITSSWRLDLEDGKCA